MKNIFYRTIGIFLIFFLFLSKASWAKEINYPDVNKDNWFYEPVMTLSNKNIIKGYTDGSFRPKDSISFGEFLKLAIYSTTNKEFTSREGEHWAMGVYREAIFRSVIDSTNFRPEKDVFNSPISRENMVYILIGVNENIQNEKAKEVESAKYLSKIKDYKDIKESSRIAVIQAYEKGLIKGKDGNFMPKDKTTRAEASQVIYRLINKDKRLPLDK